MIWDFIQNQILGMKWMNTLIGNLLEKAGVDTSGRMGGSVQFFLYDVLKITRAKQEAYGAFSWSMGKLYCSVAWHSDTILFLLVYPTFYRIYQCRASIRCDIFLFDFIANGRLREPCFTDEYLWF